MFKTASFSRLPALFPKSIGTIIVCFLIAAAQGLHMFIGYSWNYHGLITTAIQLYFLYYEIMHLLCVIKVIPPCPNNTYFQLNIYFKLHNYIQETIHLPINKGHLFLVHGQAVAAKQVLLAACMSSVFHDSFIHAHAGAD